MLLSTVCSKIAGLSSQRFLDWFELEFGRLVELLLTTGKAGNVGMATLPSGRLIRADDPEETAAAKTNVRKRQMAAGALEEEDCPPFFLWLSDPVELSEPDLEPLLLLLRGFSFFFFFLLSSFAGTVLSGRWKAQSFPR